eukprot:365018-Chlamydomonas_euryale.AAC.8
MSISTPYFASVNAGAAGVQGVLAVAAFELSVSLSFTSMQTATGVQGAALALGAAVHGEVLQLPRHQWRAGGCDVKF